MNRIFSPLKYLIKSGLFYFFRCFPVKKNKIIFCNFVNKGYGDNPKYIAQEIIDQKLNFDLVWLTSVKNKNEFPAEIRIIKYKSLKAVFELATAKIWVDNCRKFEWVRKRKSQYYIQTWHGIMSLKKIEADIKERPAYKIKKSRNDSKMINLLLSSGRARTEMFRRNFVYDGEILETGAPKCDIFFKPSNIKEKVYNYFNISSDTKIILYAPTFRKSHNTDIYDLDIERVLAAFESKYDNKFVCLMRLHPSINQKSGGFIYNGKCINASFYDDMQELLFASEILITDYSSTMYEFALMNKLVFLYASDVEDYKKNRDFYFNINELPFVLSENNDELQENINNFDSDNYTKELNKFIERFGFKTDGKASYEVVERIKQIING